jgi:hypothetical protein
MDCAYTPKWSDRRRRLEKQVKGKPNHQLSSATPIRSLATAYRKDQQSSPRHGPAGRYSRP